MTIRREGKEQEFEVTLVPPQSPIGNPPVAPPAPVGSGSPKAFGLTAVRPDLVYLVDGEGKLHALPIEPGDKSIEHLRKYYDSVNKAEHDAPLAAPSIRVQRSDMEKKLAAIGRDVFTLRQEVEKLTEAMQSLQKQLAERTSKP